MLAAAGLKGRCHERAHPEQFRILRLSQPGPVVRNAVAGVWLGQNQNDVSFARNSLCGI